MITTTKVFSLEKKTILELIEICEISLKVLTMTALPGHLNNNIKRNTCKSSTKLRDLRPMDSASREEGYG